MPPLRPVIARLFRDRGAGSAVEFALVAPVLVLLLIGMIVYGGWFWLAQGVQSLASESARAAIGGLDTAEQRSLAEAYVGAEAQRFVGLGPDKARVSVESDATAIRVRVRYDVVDHPVMTLARLVPSPPGVIERSAVVRTGGY